MNARIDSDFPTALHRRFPAGLWKCLFLLGSWLVGTVTCRGDDPPPPSAAVRPAIKAGGEVWPTAIILEPPANRGVLLDKLRHPDLLIWDGAAFDRWLATGSGGPVPSTRTGSGVVGSVAVAIQVGRNAARARVKVRLGINLAADAATSVPVGLDGQVLGRVVEAGRDLPVTGLPSGSGWAVELAGKGDHAVEIETSARVRPVGSGQALDLMIPPAALTEVELVTERPLVNAQAGPDDWLLIDPSPADGRASGHLGPRGQIELTWQEREALGDPLPPLLSARGEVAVTCGMDAVETRETWSISAVRGVVREVIIRVPPPEMVVEVQVDRHPVATNRRPTGDPGWDELLIPVADAITGAEAGPTARTATITLTTRCPRRGDGSGSDDPARYELVGHPIISARSQTGVIGVARSDGTAITAVEGRGVRRVDPGTELTEPLRSRPDRWMAFVFAAQPFELGLRVEPIAPRFEVNARSTVVLGEDRAAVTTRLIGRVWQGRLFDLRILIPPGLTFEPNEPGPDGPTIRSERRRSRSSDGPTAPAMATAEVLIATFPHPLGPGDAFEILLRGSQRLAAGERAPALGLFQPLGSPLVTTELALVSGPNRRFDLGDGTAIPHFARLDPAKPPADWVWPLGFDPAGAPTPTWLRADGAEGVVPCRVAVCPRSIRHQSSLAVAFDRTGADAVAELTGTVTNGTLTALEVALPPEVGDRWVAEAGEGLERESLDLDPATGWRQYRLKLPSATDTFQVRIRYRLDFAAEAPLRIRIEPLRVRDGTSTSQTVRLSSESGVSLQVQGTGWDETPSATKAATSDSVQEVRHAFEHLGGTNPPPLDVTVSLGKLADLPTLVASRLWLLSAEMPGGELANTAQYRLEAHARLVVLRLPAGSRWIRGAAGTVELTAAAVEQIAPDTYRITLPSAVGLGPVPLRVDSILDQPPGDGTWLAPELVGGVVQQTAWELSLLGTRAGVGVPAGWTDENRWYREGLMWKRRPRRVDADLSRWLADGRPSAEASDLRVAAPAVLESEGNQASDFAAGHHSYLFSRPGPPTTLRFPTWARPTLLLICSGPVLLVGLLILARRPPPRWVAGSMLTLGLVGGATVEPNTGLLIAESSSVGVALAATAAAIHWSLERRTRTPSVVVEPAPSVASIWAGRSKTSFPPASPSPSLSPHPNPVEADERTLIHDSTRDRVAGSTGEYPLPAAPGTGPTRSPGPSPEGERP